MDNYIYDEEEYLNAINEPKSYTYDYTNNEVYKENNSQLLIKENKTEINKLRNEIKRLNKTIDQKNKEIEENRIKYDNQLVQINKAFDNHINEYQELVQNYQIIQQELNKAHYELEQKNKIIKELKENKNINSIDPYNNNNFSNEEIMKQFQILKDRIKNMFVNFFVVEKNEKINNGIMNVALRFESNVNKSYNLESKFQRINEFINFFSKELTEFKQSKNKNKLNSNDSDNLFQKFYLEFIDTMNNFISNISFNFFNFNDFPKFSLNDSNEKKYADILFIFNKLTNFIIEYQNNNMNDNDNNINEELEKKLKEMSELLNNSNIYLNKAKQENKELKMKYGQLEQKYLNVIDFDKLNNKLNNELNKKNQQIKSLENMVTILTNRASKNIRNNNINNNMTSKSMMMNNSFCGKIVNKKIFNEIRNNQNKSSSCLNNNKFFKFMKDDKSEQNLNKFLNKYTNGEYGDGVNSGIINLREEIEKYEKEIGYNVSDDEIEKENNYNEEEEEKKYQMEGKI